MVAVSENAGNVALPNQTKADAADQALKKWAAMQIKSLGMRLIGRHTIDDVVAGMKPAEQERAKHWLNYYRIKARQGEE